MKKFCFLILLLASVIILQAQKVKYKEIFPDLEARKFNKVEPLLKRFLAEEKNTDHPNANYQMGLITEAHFLLQDIVADTSALYQFGEEALGYYRKSITLITDKELKKNDQYYQAFNRRDLRTGKFGVKLSDIHLEIEKKIASVENRIASIKSLHRAVSELTAKESELLNRFNAMATGAENYDDYLLKADLETLTILGDIQAMFKSFDDQASETVKVASELGATDYYQKIEYLPIQNFSELSAKFSASNTLISTWQFADWASATRGVLNREVFTMKNDLKAFDQKLLQSTNALKSGTVIKAPQGIPPALYSALGKYDSRSLPRKLLRARINENTIRYLTDTTMNTMLRDSSVATYQLGIADSIINALESLDKLLELDETAITRAWKYYPEYLQAYGGVNGLQQYATDTRNWVGSIRDHWQANKDFWFMRDHWGVTATDTIPLHVVDATYQGNYITRGYLDLPDHGIISWGVKNDSRIGFIAKFGADRTLSWESRFKSELFASGANHDFVSDTLAADTDQIAFYLFDPEPTGTSDLTVVNANLEGKLNWAVSTMASHKPEYTTYSHEIGETIIFFYPQEQYPLANGELGYLIINRDGKIR